MYRTEEWSVNVNTCKTIMKRIYLPLIGGIAAMMAVSCVGNSGESSSTADVRDFDVNLTVKSAEKYYETVIDGNNVYVDVSTSVQWPEKLGNYDITPLQDTIMHYAFPPETVTAGNINKTIAAYTADTSFLGADTKCVTVDSLPGGADAAPFFYDVTATLIEVNEQMVTYQVSTFTYTGGAHPYNASRPFTFDLARGRVLTAENMFISGTENEVLSIVQNGLARQLGIDPSQLENAGVFISQFTTPGQPYINNDVIVFHFNPYDIAPYSMGNIDVAVYPYELNEYLTPEVKELLGD